MRALAAADVVQLMWTGISWCDGKNISISARDCDAQVLKPFPVIPFHTGELRNIGKGILE